MFIQADEVGGIAAGLEEARKQLGISAIEVEEILPRDPAILRFQIERWLAQLGWQATGLEEKILDAVLTASQA